MKPDLNLIIGMLPTPVVGRIGDGSRIVEGVADQVLIDAGEVITELFFPLDAVVSLDQVIDDDHDDPMSSPGVALIGREGVVGLEAMFGAEVASNRATVRIAGSLLQIPVATALEEFARSGALHRVLLRSADALVAQLSGNSSCERVHPIQKRLIRWLLLFSDRYDSSELLLTQNTLARILAVRRVSISAAAALLQLAGVITYHRGMIVLLDREALESKACDCYAHIKKRYADYLQADG